ncbi:S8 family serine peptidase [Nanoarchaeota archaeon]
MGTKKPVKYLHRISDQRGVTRYGYVKNSFLVFFVLSLMFSGIYIMFSDFDSVEIAGAVVKELESSIPQEIIDQIENGAEEVEVILEVENPNPRDKVIGKGSGGSSLVVVTVPADEIEEIAEGGEIYPNLEYNMLVDENLEQINVQAARDLGFSGEGVKVAVIDSGVYADNVLFEGRIFSQESFVNESVGDENGHGSHVAGTVVKVAPDVKIIDAKVLDRRGKGDTVSIVGGIFWSIEQGADVISISLGTTRGADLLVNSALQQAIDQGIIVVVAGGNCRDECPDANCGSFRGVTAPGSFEKVITVGAVDGNNEVACFSSEQDFGSYSKPEVYAPGVGIVSVLLGGEGSMSGTSMATPHVSGVAALLLEKDNSLNHNSAKVLFEQRSVEGIVDLVNLLNDSWYVEEVEEVPEANVTAPVFDGSLLLGDVGEYFFVGVSDEEAYDDTVLSKKEAKYELENNLYRVDEISFEDNTALREYLFSHYPVRTGEVEYVAGEMISYDGKLIWFIDKKIFTVSSFGNPQGLLNFYLEQEGSLVEENMTTTLRSLKSLEYESVSATASFSIEVNPDAEFTAESIDLENADYSAKEVTFENESGSYTIMASCGDYDDTAGLCENEGSWGTDSSYGVYQCKDKIWIGQLFCWTLVSEDGDGDYCSVLQDHTHYICGRHFGDCDSDTECYSSYSCVGGPGFIEGCCYSNEEFDGSYCYEVCDAKYLNEYQCSGDTRQRKYQLDNCNTEWRTDEVCDDYSTGGWGSDYCSGNQEDIRQARNTYDEFCSSSTKACEDDVSVETQLVSSEGDGNYCDKALDAGCACTEAEGDCDVFLGDECASGYYCDISWGGGTDYCCPNGESWDGSQCSTPCDLTAAYWEVDKAVPGQKVKLTVEGSSCQDGAKASVQIMEVDDFFGLWGTGDNFTEEENNNTNYTSQAWWDDWIPGNDDDVKSGAFGEQTFSNGKIELEWTAERQLDLDDSETYNEEFDNLYRIAAENTESKIYEGNLKVEECMEDSHCSDSEKCVYNKCEALTCYDLNYSKGKCSPYNLANSDGACLEGVDSNTDVYACIAVGDLNCYSKAAECGVGGCEDTLVEPAQCISPPGPGSCEGVTCPDHCAGTTRYYGGFCSLGECSYSTEENAQTCIGVGSCSSNEDCRAGEFCDSSTYPARCRLETTQMSECGTIGEYSCRGDAITRCEDADDNEYNELVFTGDICRGAETCVEGSSTCQSRNYVTDIIIEEAEEGILVYKQPFDYLAVTLEHNGDETINLNYSANSLLLIEGDCRAGVIDVRNDMECLFLVVGEAGRENIVIPYGDSEKIGIINDPSLIIITDKDRLYDRFVGDSGGVDNLLKQSYTSAIQNGEKGIVYDLDNYIVSLEGSYSSYLTSSYDYDKVDTYSSRVSWFTNSKCGESCDNVMILGDDYVVPYQRREFAWRTDTWGNAELEGRELATDTSYTPVTSPTFSSLNSDQFFSEGQVIVVVPHNLMNDDSIQNFRESILYNYGREECTCKPTYDSAFDFCLSPEFEVINCDNSLYATRCDEYEEQYCQEEFELGSMTFKSYKVGNKLLNDINDVELVDGSEIGCNSFRDLGSSTLILIGNAGDNNAIKCLPWVEQEDYSQISIQRNVWDTKGHSLVLNLPENYDDGNLDYSLKTLQLIVEDGGWQEGFGEYNQLDLIELGMIPASFVPGAETVVDLYSIQLDCPNVFDFNSRGKLQHFDGGMMAYCVIDFVSLAITGGSAYSARSSMKGFNAVESMTGQGSDYARVVQRANPEKMNDFVMRKGEIVPERLEVLRYAGEPLSKLPGISVADKAAGKVSDTRYFFMGVNSRLGDDIVKDYKIFDEIEGYTSQVVKRNDFVALKVDAGKISEFANKRGLAIDYSDFSEPIHKMDVDEIKKANKLLVDPEFSRVYDVAKKDIGGFDRLHTISAKRPSPSLASIGVYGDVLYIPIEGTGWAKSGKSVNVQVKFNFEDFKPYVLNNFIFHEAGHGKYAAEFPNILKWNDGKVFTNGKLNNIYHPFLESTADDAHMLLKSEYDRGLFKTSQIDYYTKEAVVEVDTRTLPKNVRDAFKFPDPAEAEHIIPLTYTDFEFLTFIDNLDSYDKVHLGEIARIKFLANRFDNLEMKKFVDSFFDLEGGGLKRYLTDVKKWDVEKANSFVTKTKNNMDSMALDIERLGDSSYELLKKPNKGAADFEEFDNILQEFEDLQKAMEVKV